ncbi:DUF4226 domain-containing protein [Mycolicibacterium septicum]|uniref:DUF4226 domain-containing protein n=1 Tax=Mycolicibacterium septicum TaxID=98668 RepID=UPI00235DC940|nr:DUF4226 domain-containing protein [Mycolicibacterium septicum]
MSIGFPDFVDDILEHAIKNMINVVGAAARVFGGDHPPEHTSAQQLNGILYGPGGSPPAAPPPSPTPADDSGGLHDGAEAAGEEHSASVDSGTITDEKIAELLKQVFASNEAARDKVTAIIADIQAKAKQVGPELGDPAAVMAVQQYLDQKLGEIQKVLGDAHVDAKTQAAIMDALGDEYRGNGPQNDGGTSEGQGDNASEPGPGNGGNAGDTSGGINPAATAVGADDGGAVGADPVVDPLAGLGPLGMGGLGGDPLGGLGGLGSVVPGMLAGLGGGMSPLDGLAPAMAGLGSAIPGLATQFGDKSQPDAEKAADFTDDRDPAKDGEKTSGKADEDTAAHGDETKPSENTGDEQPPTSDAKGDSTDPVSGPQPVASTSAVPAAAPAAAQGGSDPQHTVSMPDGSAVTAADAHRADAMRAVLGGSTVTAGYGDQNVQIPPPGTPVTHPVDRNSLQPGDYAQYQSQPPVMYMGNGKIWLDGQLQPLGALKSSPDFLGWTQPPGSAGAATPAPVAPPATPPTGMASG